MCRARFRVHRRRVQRSIIHFEALDEPCTEGRAEPILFAFECILVAFRARCVYEVTSWCLRARRKYFFDALDAARLFDFLWSSKVSRFLFLQGFPAGDSVTRPAPRDFVIEFVGRSVDFGSAMFSCPTLSLFCDGIGCRRSTTRERSGLSRSFRVFKWSVYVRTLEGFLFASHFLCWHFLV